MAQIFGVSPQTVYKWMRRYREGGRAVLENRSCVPHRTQRKYPLPTPEAKQQLFATLHAPPSAQGLNRTTWRIPDLVDALRSKGVMVNEPMVSRLIRADGDPLRGGRMLVPPGDLRSVPQWQKSKEALIVTAALELASNQVSHFYSARKNTGEILLLLDRLIREYADRRTLFLTWNAAP